MTAATVIFGALVVSGILDDYHHPSKKTSINVQMIIGMIGLLMILIALFIWPPFVAAN